MKSRAHMLLEKEYLKLQKEKIWGIQVEPLNEGNFYLWEARINGLKDTMWEDGIFKLYLKFNQQYNCVPPEIMFTTIPFHPNVDITTGKPCVDFLDNIDSWNQNYSIGYLLLVLQTLLVNPVLENAVNEEAATMYVKSPDTYRQMVISCVLASQRLEANLPISRNNDGSSSQYLPQSFESQKPSCVKRNEITFSNYLSLWKGIATSSKTGKTNPLDKVLKNDINLQETHFEICKEELAAEIRSQFKEHNRIMRGTVVEKKQEYYQQNNPNKVILFTPFLSDTTDYKTLGEEINNEREVEELLNWTMNLSPEQIS